MIQTEFEILLISLSKMSNFNNTFFMSALSVANEHLMRYSVPLNRNNTNSSIGGVAEKDDHATLEGNRP